MFAQQVKVLWSGPSPRDAALLISQIAKKLLSTGFCAPKSTESTRSSGCKRARSENKEDAYSAKRAALMGCPGVSQSVAEALLQKWPSMRDLAAASAAEVASVKVSDKRSVGPTVAARLLKMLE